MRVSSIISDIIQIINRNHSELQGLDADDHLQYDRVDGTRNYIKNLLTTQGDLLVRGATGLERLPAGELGKVLMSQGSNSKPVWSDLPVEYLRNFVIASDNLRNSNDTERSTTSTTPVKLKETRIGDAYGTLRIYFEVASSEVGYYATAQVYRNGQPVGTARSINTTTFVSHVQDISGWSANDYIQIYAWGSDGVRSARVRNFRISCDADYKRIWKLGNTELNPNNYIITKVLSQLPTFTNTVT
jgi:hypothetical protein